MRSWRRCPPGSADLRLGAGRLWGALGPAQAGPDGLDDAAGGGGQRHALQVLRRKPAGVGDPSQSKAAAGPAAVGVQGHAEVAVGMPDGRRRF